MATVLRALGRPEYRLFFLGQLISLIGTWMGSTATSWLAFRISGSETVLGLVAFTGQIPLVLIAPIAGVYVDSLSPVRVLRYTQIASMLQSIVMAICVLFGWISVPLLLFLSLFQGCVNGIDLPGRQALLPTLIKEKDLLPNAIALNSAMFNLARLAGPALGGITVALVGEAACFSIDALSYVCILYVLFRLPVTIQTAASLSGDASPVKRFMEGITYIKDTPVILRMLLLTATVGFLGPVPLLLGPVFASTVFNGGPEIFGMLTASSGLGAFSSAIFLASRRSVRGTTLRITIGVLMLCPALLLFGVTSNLYSACVLLFCEGACVLLVSTGCNTLLQLVVRPAARGRVLALYSVSFLGAMPLGSVVFGFLAERTSAPTASMIAGLLLVPAAVSFALQSAYFRTEVRRLASAEPT